MTGWYDPPIEYEPFDPEDEEEPMNDKLKTQKIAKLKAEIRYLRGLHQAACNDKRWTDASDAASDLLRSTNEIAGLDMPEPAVPA